MIQSSLVAQCSVCVCVYTGGVVSRSDLADVLEEIYKVDRNFRMDPFLIECQHEIAPNILEAYLRGDLEILKDWCHEPVNIIV